MVQPKTKPRAAGKVKEALDSYRLDDAPGFLLRVALRTHTSIFGAKMIEEFTGPQFSTLAKLKEVGPCSQNHLGRLIHYDSATITGVINRLKSRGLIKSSKDPLDPRRREIDLTEKERRIADAAIETIGEISGETFPPLTQGEFRALTEILKDHTTLINRLRAALNIVSSREKGPAIAPGRVEGGKQKIANLSQTPNAEFDRRNPTNDLQQQYYRTY